jgi:hypothetical protein
MVSFGTKWEEITEGWRKNYNIELHNFPSSAFNTSVIKSERMRWLG